MGREWAQGHRGEEEDDGQAGQQDVEGDLVGAKLREILATDDIGIRLHDPASDLIHYLYEVEHGERLTIPPAKPSALYRKLCEDRRAIFGPTTEIAQTYNMKLVPGTGQIDLKLQETRSKSSVKPLGTKPANVAAV